MLSYLTATDLAKHGRAMFKNRFVLLALGVVAGAAIALLLRGCAPVPAPELPALSASGSTPEPIVSSKQNHKSRLENFTTVRTLFDTQVFVRYIDIPVVGTKIQGFNGFKFFERGAGFTLTGTADCDSAKLYYSLLRDAIVLAHSDTTKVIRETDSVYRADTIKYFLPEPWLFVEALGEYDALTNAVRGGVEGTLRIGALKLSASPLVGSDGISARVRARVPLWSN